MARGYLGKISAVVTVNTSDLAPKLNAGSKQITSFAKSTSSTISSAMSAAGKSFDQIFTPLQKLQRALAVANKEPISLNVDVSKVEKLVLAANQLSKPLGQSTKQFAALAESVQRQFSPALEGVQAGLTNLRSQIDAGTSSGGAQFRGLAADVELVNGAIGRLKEQAALSAKLFTGQELTFVRPESIDSLNRLAAAQQKLAAAPAATRSSPIARDLLEDSQILSKQIENISARIERLRAQGLDITVSQAGLDLAVRRVNEVASLIDQITEAPKEVKIDVNADNLIARAKAQQEYYAESERLQKQAAADAAAPLIARARAEQEYYAESDRLQKQAAADAAAPLIARARAEQEYYAESDRLQKQAASDAAAPLIARARAEQEYYAESRRLQEQSAADAAAPLIARARAEQEFYAESKRLQEQAAADEAAPLIRRARGEMDFEAENARLLGASREGADLGLNLDDPSRQIEQLRSGIVSVKGQIDSLPASIRSQLLPAIKAAEAEFLRLRNSPDATAEEIDNAAASVRKLGADAANAARFTETLAQSLSGRGAATQSASLEGLRATILSLGASASGPVVAAFEALRAAKERAAASGDFTSSRRQIAQLEQEAINAVAAFSGLSAAQVRTQQAAASAKFGDVGRGGADKASLALNQLAFAIDDFFSSTGGLEFKLRAVSNNITQLGFVAGGTTGLFISLGAVIGGQVALAISKFVFETDKADEALKALNAALEANQRNVEQLAEAYKRLAQAIAGAVLSPRDKVARERRQQGEDLTRQRQAVEEEAFAAISPEVSRVRGERELLKKRQQESNDIAERVRLAREIQANVARERELLNNRGSQEGERLVQEGADRSLAVQEVRLRRARARRSLGSDERPGENVEDLEAVVAQAQARRDAARQRRLPGSTTSVQTREQLDTLQGSLSSAQQAREDLVRSLPPRTPGTRITAVDELDDTIRRLKERIDVVSAVLGGQLAGELIAGQGKIQDSLTAAADSISTLDIVSAIGAERDRLANELTAIADELASVTDPGRAAALKEQQDELEKSAAAVRSAAESTERFAAVVDKVARQLSDTVLQEVEGRADQARREVNAAEGAAQAGPGGGVTQRDIDQRREEAAADRRRADADVARARAGQRDFDQERRRVIAAAEADMAAGNVSPEAQRLINERDAARATLDSEKATVDEKRAAQETLVRAQAGLDDIFSRSTAGRTLARRADSLDAEAQRAEAVQRQVEADRESVGRGRELSLTPAQRAGEQLNQELQDIRNYFSRAVEESSGLPEDVAKIRGEMNEAINRTLEDQMRQAAPLTVGMADARQNALLQGPSRAALGATDVATMQGQAELNRLLRGDDPNKNVDLVELQREANKLLEVISKKENQVL